VIPDGVNELARERRDSAEALKKIQRDAFGFENRSRTAAQFYHSVAGCYRVAVLANNVDIDGRIDLAKNFGSGPGAGYDRWFTAHDASGGVQGFRDEKFGRNVAVANVFLKGSSNRIVMIWLHGGAEAA
jgi:hypothetical protein